MSISASVILQLKLVLFLLFNNATKFDDDDNICAFAFFF